MTSRSRYDDRPLARATTQVDNERNIVTEWRFPAGAHTGWHRHHLDYVVVPMSTGTLMIDTGDELCTPSSSRASHMVASEAPNTTSSMTIPSSSSSSRSK